jgi:PPP family 3-phenylpropionic acid transporter
VQLIVLGCAAAVVRWLVMGFDPPLALLVLLQVSHSLTYTASHIGAIHFISGMVADRQSGTAQALYASVTGGIGLGAAMLIAGPLYASYGGRGYWAMAVMAAMALVAALALQRSAHPHSAACGGETSAPS